MGTAARELLSAGALWYESWLANPYADAPYWPPRRATAALDRIEIPILRGSYRPGDRVELPDWPPATPDHVLYLAGAGGPTPATIPITTGGSGSADVVTDPLGDVA